MTDRKPLIGITMGDPAGIGPEVVTKLAISRLGSDTSVPLIIGDAMAISGWCRRLGGDHRVIRIDDVNRMDRNSEALHVLDRGDLDTSSVDPGSMTALSGEASMRYNRVGAELAMAAAIDALVTAPVTKASAKLAGYDFAGQAEYFAELAGGLDFKTILIWKSFKAALFTTHLPLIEACAQVRKDALLSALAFLHDRRAELGHDELRIAVAALNPHAGESGTMGREELDEIAPAIAAAQSLGMNVDGPFPVNALISPPYDGRGYDITLALYHDQVVARMNMNETTTLTFGLPFIRTSVGHGSALDIAGRGTADPQAMAITYDHTVALATSRLRAAGVPDLQPV